MAEAKTAPIIVHFLNKFYGRPWEEGCENPYLPYFFELTNRYSIEINLIKKANNKRNRRIAFRKKAYKILPYKLYLLMEKILYIKRKKQFYKLYKKVY